MRRNIFLAVVVLLVTLTSCSSDMSDIKPPEPGSVTRTHRLLSLSQVQQRLNSVWSSLPSNGPATRSDCTQTAYCRKVHMIYNIRPRK